MRAVRIEGAVIGYYKKDKFGKYRVYNVDNKLIGQNLGSLNNVAWVLAFERVRPIRDSVFNKIVDRVVKKKRAKVVVNA